MRIAVAQLPGMPLAAWRDTVVRVEHDIAAAAESGAEVVVFPECVWPTYVLGSRARYDAARAAGLPEPAWFLDRVAATARRAVVAVCIGFVEETADRLHNAAALFNPTGDLAAIRRKTYLWDFDHDYFTAGDDLSPVRLGTHTAGILICADARVPEIAATLVTRGARLILQPTAWVNTGGHGAERNIQADFMISARAAELGVPFASCSKWGQEGRTTFVGQSQIVAADGHCMARLSTRETSLALAEVQIPATARLEVHPDERPRLMAAMPPVGVAAAVPEAYVWAAAGTNGWELRLLPVPAARIEADSICGIAADAGATAGPAGIRIMAIPLAEAARFAPLRCAALDGVHLAVVFGPADDFPLAALRSRAAENRIFVAVLGSGRPRWIDPRGHVHELPTGPSTPPPGSLPTALRVDLAQAADKRFARGTDALNGRTPALYEL
ncbi:MAG: carbon-nitrogen hydrolase family protein [Phycisphaerales bacterium]|nr:carbon-nitrogen hydrolase family protein [Phycisphaerales bacterium]